jgi:type II secretory ATPase GspE/PulE/Tfp pilus assembly ATPase PilB-like protein
LLSDLLTEAYGFILVAGMSGTETAGSLRAMLAVAAGPQHSVALIERALRLELGPIAHCLVGEDSPAPAVQAYSIADADVVVLDAIANSATARAVCLTGRDLLVLAGIGARGAAEALARLIDLKVAPWAMGDSMLGIVQQHNARRLCDACKQSVAPDAAMLQRLGLTGEEIGGGVYQPGSCDHCGHSGHVGRISVRSLVPLTGQPADLIRREASTREVIGCVEGLARAALCRAGLAKVVAGHISLAELVRVVGE